MSSEATAINTGCISPMNDAALRACRLTLETDGEAAAAVAAVAAGAAVASSPPRETPPEAGEKPEMELEQEADVANFNWRPQQPSSNAEADTAGGYAEMRPAPAPVSSPQADSEFFYGAAVTTPSSRGASPVRGGTLGAGNTMCSSVGDSSCRDPYVYVNGAPVIKNRRKFMSFDQLMLLCKELKVVPDLLTRFEVSQVFKNAQCAGAPSLHGSSIHGYLSKEAFVDAAGQLAIEAYSKQPFSEEYPAAHEKIHAFFLTVLPSSSREVHERFLYGCNGRGRG